MGTYVHTIDSDLHERFLNEKRRDPVTKEVLKPGDEIVFCAKCRSAFLLYSWEGLGRLHCRQSETLNRFPTINTLIVSREKGGPRGCHNVRTIPDEEPRITGFSLFIATVFLIASTILFLWKLSHDAEVEQPQTHTSEIQTANRIQRGVVRAQFTSLVREREPVDNIGSVVYAKPFKTKKVYYFTEIRNMRGESIIHRWEYEGKIEAEVPLSIGSDRWRTKSSKYLEPQKLGRWRVVVLDSQRKAIHRDNFMYKY